MCSRRFRRSFRRRTRRRSAGSDPETSDASAHRTPALLAAAADADYDGHDLCSRGCDPKGIACERGGAVETGPGSTTLLTSRNRHFMAWWLLGVSVAHPPRGESTGCAPPRTIRPRRVFSSDGLVPGVGFPRSGVWRRSPRTRRAAPRAGFVRALRRAAAAARRRAAIRSSRGPHPRGRPTTNSPIVPEAGRTARIRGTHALGSFRL